MMPPAPSSARTFALLFLGIFALLVGTNWRFYFASPNFEEGDAAVNALMIDRAKSLRQIHGNYSRYHFQHPGPAFFYVYALAERVLCDAIPTGWPPNSVHSLAGLALQTAFFALALTLAASWISAPLFLALAILAAALHFTHVPGAFSSIWSPHVLLMPFLAFWVACISVAAGRGRHLPWVFLCGSFLVHAHVAQLLFVVVLFFCAYARLGWTRWRAGHQPLAPWRAFPREHVVALSILLVFLLPIGLDLLNGSQSNFNAILRYLRNSSREHKTLANSLLYFLSFFTYRDDQTTLFAPGSLLRLSFLREHPWAYLGWLAAVGAAVGTLAGRFGRALGETRRILWTALPFWAITAGLCLVWGTQQSGEMFEFNGNFYYSLIYGMMLVFCTLLAALLPWARILWFAWPLCAGAALLAVRGFSLPATTADNNKGLDMRNATLAALRADPRPAAPKLLVFPHDDWPKAAATALTLERAGKTFYVGGEWTFMFGRARQLPRPLLVDPNANLSVWRFLSVSGSAEGVRFGGPLRVTFESATLSPDHGLIDFSRDGNLAYYTMHGLVAPDGSAAWTQQPDVALQFRPVPATHDVDLCLEASPFLVGDLLKAQPVELWFNGMLLSETRFTGPGLLHARVSRDLWNRNQTALLYLHLPNASSPAQFRMWDDPRLLGLEISRLTTQSAAP